MQVAVHILLSGGETTHLGTSTRSISPVIDHFCGSTPSFRFVERYCAVSRETLRQSDAPTQSRRAKACVTGGVLPWLDRARCALSQASHFGCRSIRHPHPTPDSELERVASTSTEVRRQQ